MKILKQQRAIYDCKIAEILQGKPKETLENYLLSNYLNDKKLYNKFSEYNVLPYQMEVEPITRCFLKCRYCQVPFWERRKNPDMNLNTFIHIVEKLPQLLEIKIQGQGEPLLNKDFISMIKYAVERNILVRTYTNGVLLTEQKCKEIVDSGIFEIRISMDGASEKVVEKLRFGVNYQDLLNNIKCLLNVRGQRELPLINIWMVASKENFNEIPKLVELAYSLGVDGVKIQTKLTAKPNEKVIEKVKKESIDIESEQCKNIIKEAKEIARKLDFNLEIMHNTRNSNNPCWGVLNYACISVEGAILPCTKITDPSILNFGNILEESFEKIFNSNEYTSFRKDVLECNIKDKEFCTTCFKK